MDADTRPRIELARSVLPGRLLTGLTHIFAQGLKDTVLAGGSSLAGFYAGHRRSDDLDFFTRDDGAQQVTVLAIESLPSAGAKLTPIRKTNQFFQATCVWSDYSHTVTSVIDSNLFRVGTFVEVTGGVRVVDLETLLKMKAATLVSRCSEKDLYDLLWLFPRFPQYTLSDLIRLGTEMDAGVNGEALILGISGAILKLEACDFSLDPAISKTEIFHRIEGFRKELLQAVHTYLKAEEPLPLKSIVDKIKRWDRTGATDTSK